MARGLEQHKARKNAVANLGRTLSRRARNRCELCGDAASLVVVEVPPVEEDPEAEHAVLVCHPCADALDGRLGDDNRLRFLAEQVWSEVQPVQLAAVRLARQLADRDVTWAREALEQLYLDPEIEALL